MGESSLGFSPKSVLVVGVSDQPLTTTQRAGADSLERLAAGARL